MWNPKEHGMLIFTAYMRLYTNNKYMQLCSSWNFKWPSPWFFLHRNLPVTYIGHTPDIRCYKMGVQNDCAMHALNLYYFE